MTNLRVLRAEEFAADQREADARRERERGDAYQPPTSLPSHLVVRGNVLWDEFRGRPVQHGPHLCEWAVIDARFALIYAAYGEAARGECSTCGTWPGHWCSDRYGRRLDAPHYRRKAAA